jgi:ABC-type lipoprotein export system ATPase subunit
VAKAIINDPSIMPADEPTGALDSAKAEEVLKIMDMLNIYKIGE